MLAYSLQQLYTIHMVEVSINGILNNPIAICSPNDDRCKLMQMHSHYHYHPTC
jgi:hypothetical protein